MESTVLVMFYMCLAVVHAAAASACCSGAQYTVVRYTHCGTVPAGFVRPLEEAVRWSRYLEYLRGNRAANDLQKAHIFSIDVSLGESNQRWTSAS